MGTYTEKHIDVPIVHYHRFLAPWVHVYDGIIDPTLTNKRKPATEMMLDLVSRKVHTITFWTNGFTVNDGPLRRLDDPQNAYFLEIRLLFKQGPGKIFKGFRRKG
ncbi:serine/threonine protein phosphatase 2A 55 kDa regulatory subunit B prime gamma [Artemisia annua]|uniref:Serine/threonine protein phosphatase 2A 55 kDa regulatory subunit B prime gamma n=1 Tax=Artemisia annua TaxID=35608 RepID=A0A2U1KWP9_ARTAN|nr:serine/threonine protein phosphatase 2A 55 kDa regulatory subunit B prime gamma [Artemisia annua]